jgi:hypothetical protein
VPVQLDGDVVERLMALVEQDPDLAVTVDLEARELRAGDLVASFPLDDFTRWRLMEGLDDIGLTLRAEHEIDAYETRRPTHLPTTLVGPGVSEELAAQLAVRLRDAHRRVATLDASPDEKGRVARRLIALTDASKHDVARASARLDMLLADLDAGLLPPDEATGESL